MPQNAAPLLRPLRMAEAIQGHFDKQIRHLLETGSEGGQRRDDVLVGGYVVRSHDGKLFRHLDAIAKSLA